MHFLAIANIADVAHLNDFGRPVFGGHYEKAPFGPLNVEIAAILKGDPVSLAIAGLNDGRNWRVHETTVLHLKWNGIATYRNFVSRSDLTAMTAATNLFYDTAPENRFDLFNKRAMTAYPQGIIPYDAF